MMNLIIAFLPGRDPSTIGGKGLGLQMNGITFR